MARPRSFNLDEALDCAMHLFWKKGYEATSLKDLLSVLDIRPPSFYQAFGSKHELYLMALDRYATVMGQQLERDLAPHGDTLHRRLKSLFYRVAKESAREVPSKGCLLVNATVERAAHDEAVRSRVAKRFATNRDYFASAIEAAKVAGEDITQDTNALALLLVNLYHGLRVTGKAQVSEENLRSIVDANLRML